LKIPRSSISPYAEKELSFKQEKGTLDQKMAEPPVICSSFGSSAVFDLTRPAAFRPLLTEDLALSGESHLFKKYSLILSKGQILSIREIRL